MTWRYLPVLNACLQVLSTISLGAICRNLAPDTFNTFFVQHSVRFVFCVAIPCLVIKGIGVGVDFYSNAFSWRYIVAFLILRVIALFVGIAISHFRRNHVHNEEDTHCGTIAVYWLSMTWISTVILGIPILTAVTNSPSKGRVYGILAGISSFIFQLPFQLFLLECHKFEKRHLNDEEMDSGSSGVMPCREPKENYGEGRIMSPGEGGPANWAIFVTSKELWKFIVYHMSHNPVFLGIIFGFVVSLSTFGKRFLNPLLVNNGTANDNYIEWLQFLVDTLGWFGDCASPLSLFSMGIWIHEQQGANILSVGIYKLTLFMLTKLIIVPLIMVGLATALQLEGESGRAAVLISSLPISMASFSLGNTYQIGEALLSANVTLGTFLMLPSVIVWNFVLDKLELFPISFEDK